MRKPALREVFALIPRPGAILLLACLTAASVGPIPLLTRPARADVNREMAVAEVGPSTLTAADVLALADQLVLTDPSEDPLADRKRLLEPVVHARMMVIEAKARGLEDETLRRQLEGLERDRLVSEIERVEIRERIVVDESVISEGVQRSGLLLHLHHLETAAGSTADSLLARIAAGESFAELARAHSTEARSAADGGALPPVRWGTLPPDLEEVAYRLAPGEIAGPFPAREAWHLIRLDSVTHLAADPDSLRESVTRTYERARFNEGQIRLLDEMKERLHFAIDDSVIGLFLERMRQWKEDGASETATAPGRDRFGFSAEERVLAIFSYDLPDTSTTPGTSGASTSVTRTHGRFTIGDFSDYMADQPAGRVSQRSERQRVDRDLDQYFRRHAYSDLAEARGYRQLSGIEPELRYLRERSLIHRLYLAEVALPAPPTDEELHEYHAAHAERYRAADDTTRVLTFDAAREPVRADLIEAREAERFRSLIERLAERYPVTYHEDALMRLPLGRR
jgi:hypothetical protein